MKVVVLGAGLVGRPMALDLAQDADMEVTVVDRRPDVLEAVSADNPNISVLREDLSSPERVAQLVSDHDLVLSAVPGHMGYATLEAVITAGKHVVDIAFFPENPFDLDDLARRNGVVAIVDCGVSPGMSNVLIGHAARQLDRVERVLLYVGGLPAVREWPYEYKAGFSPLDVVEEYTRPARYLENGRLVIRAALTDREYLDFPAVGTLEAFNTDGLRTLLHTIEAPNLKEKTLRYPGHAEMMAVLRETGFFDTESVEIGACAVRPIDLTAKLLFPKWKLEPGDEDITVLKVIVEGAVADSPKRYVYELFDRYDERTGVHSMARTTGYTATAAARLLAAGLYTTPGITPPEFLGRSDACVRFLLDGLRARGVVYTETVE